ncbi:MAG: putative membrane protein, partial [uncultured Nocardioides sp.]
APGGVVLRHDAPHSVPLRVVRLRPGDPRRVHALPARHDRVLRPPGLCLRTRAGTLARARHHRPPAGGQRLPQPALPVGRGRVGEPAARRPVGGDRPRRRHDHAGDGHPGLRRRPGPQGGARAAHARRPAARL